MILCRPGRCILFGSGSTEELAAAIEKLGTGAVNRGRQSRPFDALQTGCDQSEVDFAAVIHLDADRPHALFGGRVYGFDGTESPKCVFHAIAGSELRRVR